ncbi:MAG: XRE family transcriptional regulator [Desulfosporosinus sp.]
MFDKILFADKLIKYREQFNVSIQQLATSTGISTERLSAFERKEEIPDGDEILILADYYKCDYRFFISNEKIAAFEQTEYLFRMLGDELSTRDRWSIQEALYLAECEAFLINEIGRESQIIFTFVKKGNYFKGHGEQAAIELRRSLGYSPTQVPVNIYSDFRSIGIHIFRRRLENSNISGICIKHPVAGKCVLVNFNEDVYRQRFTVAHEVGHSILDDDKDVVVSYKKWDKNDLSEIRANTFASSFLLPAEFLKQIPEAHSWNQEKALEWAERLRVSTNALANALKGLNLINTGTERLIKSVRVPSYSKYDPELPPDLPLKAKERMKKLIECGLSDQYLRLCLDAYRNNIISLSRMAEMLLVDEPELLEIINLYGERIQYD